MHSFVPDHVVRLLFSRKIVDFNTTRKKDVMVEEHQIRNVE